MENQSTNVSSYEQDPWYLDSTDGPSSKNEVYQYFYERQMFAAMVGIGAILGTVGNSFVIVAVALFKKLRTTTNVFVVNLAAADILTCMFTPWQAVALHGEDGWPIPSAPWLCNLAAFVIVITFGCSINNLALIAVNRWVGITKSRYTTRRIYTTRKLGLMVVLAWAIPLGCALTPVLTDFGQLGYEKLYSTCTWIIEKSAYYSIMITALYYPVQLLLITLSYTSIFCYVYRTSRRMTRADASSVSAKIARGGNQSMRKMLWKRQLDVTKNLLYIVLAFLVCITPYFTSIIFTTNWSRQLTPWAGIILFCNSSVNPFIYATSHPDFKEAFSFMIRCRFSTNGRQPRSSKPPPAIINSDANCTASSTI